MYTVVIVNDCVEFNSPIEFSVSELCMDISRNLGLIDSLIYTLIYDDPCIANTYDPTNQDKLLLVIIPLCFLNLTNCCLLS